MRSPCSDPARAIARCGNSLVITRHRRFRGNVLRSEERTDPQKVHAETRAASEGVPHRRGPRSTRASLADRDYYPDNIDAQISSGYYCGDHEHEMSVMNDLHAIEFTAFIGSRLLASGSLDQVALAAKKAVDRGAQQPVLIYNDSTGHAIDIDSRGSGAEILARLARPPPPSLPPGRGRPKPAGVA